MKNVQLLGLAALLSLTAACMGSTSPDSGNAKDSPLSADKGETPNTPAPSSSNGRTPDPAPAPATPTTPSTPSTPTAGCTPQASPSNGSPTGENPAAKYCVELGYSLTDSSCMFPDGTSCDEWAFWGGSCGAAHSFCAVHGGTVSLKTENMGSWTAQYAWCTLPDGHACKDTDFASTCECK